MGFLDGVKKTLGSTAQALQKAADNMPDNIKDINLKDINLNDTVAGITKKGTEVFNTAVKEGSTMINNAVTSMKKEEVAEPTSFLTTEDALKVFYYLMSADGKMTEDEMEQFEQIGREADEMFSYHKAEIVMQCDENIGKETDPDFYMDNLIRCASEAIQHSQQTAEGTVSEKNLLWNMLSIAFADGNYAIEEKRFIKAITNVLKIEDSVTQEMVNAIKTMLALGSEEEWLKKEDRKYSEIEPHLKEIAKRKNAVMQGVRALIMD